MKNPRDVVIVSAVRSAVGRGKKGTLSNTPAIDLAALVLKETLARVKFSAEGVEDVILGCAMPEGEQGLNIGRLAALAAGFPDSVPGVTINRFCSSGLQAIASGAQEIATGMADCVLAGGIESMSAVPMGGFKNAVNAKLLDLRPEAYMGMGHTAERLATQYSITREQQDEFALESHRKAAAAQAKGLFKDEIVPVPVEVDRRDGAKIVTTTKNFDTDELVRADADAAQMAKLKPAFKLTGSVTPGNSSPLSDGAAAVLLMSREKAESLGLEILGKYVGFSVAGVPPEIMGIGPVAAVPRVLARAGRKMEDLTLVELNEAFAAQSMAVLHELSGIDRAKVNVNGGAIALGHPLGATGAKLTVSLLHELRRRGGGLGLVTMCIGGGQGAAGLFEV